jgi:pimeloyl-ACP methyl ester carboxylesterase
MNKRRFRMIILIVTLPLIAWAAYQIRIEHYPVNIQPTDHWEPFVGNLNAERERFFVDRDGVQLEAELFVPRGGRSAKPAIVFSTGSGDSLYQNYSPMMVETVILDQFLERDMAVLLVNKRGMGASEGNWTKNDFQGRADDLYAAVASLHDHPAIDASRIGLVGHSQGGWIVTLAAAQHPDIAFFVSLAGPTTTVATNMLDNYVGGYGCDGYTGTELEEQAAKRMRMTRLGARVGETIPFGMFGFDAGIIDYDPADALQTVRSPGLLVYAELDWQVSPTWSLDRLEELFPSGLPANLTTKTITGVNHSFLLVEDMCTPQTVATDNGLSPELAAELDAWLQAQGY